MAGALLGRLSTPDEFKAPAVFLLSEGSSFMTGADLRVDGGHCASAWAVYWRERGMWSCWCIQHSKKWLRSIKWGPKASILSYGRHLIIQSSWKTLSLQWVTHICVWWPRFTQVPLDNSIASYQVGD
jgi:hypothetical protein